MSMRGLPGDAEAPENKFGIRDLEELQRLETPLAIRRLLELQFCPTPGSFDTEHLCSIHRHIFQDVYAWAGELRAVTISKAGAPFPPPEFLRRSLDALFAELKNENCLRRLPASSWSHRAAYFPGGDQRDSSVPRGERASPARIHSRVGVGGWASAKLGALHARRDDSRVSEQLSAERLLRA